MRDGFAEIVSGWMLVDDFDELTDRIERAADWTKANGPLEPDEQATVKLMVESQVARGICRGDFEPYIPSSSSGAALARRDPRIPYGARCTWWDDIYKIGRRPAGGGFNLPCCPHCRNMLFEYPDEATWWAAVDKYEAAGNPGYRKLVEWSRGKCFPSWTDAKRAYAAEQPRPDA